MILLRLFCNSSATSAQKAASTAAFCPPGGGEWAWRSVLLRQLAGDFYTGGGGGKAALTGLAQVGGEQTAHAAHGVDDLVAGDGVVHPGQCHVGAGDRVHRAHHVALDAGHLYQTRHWPDNKMKQ